MKKQLKLTPKKPKILNIRNKYPAPKVDPGRRRGIGGKYA